MISSLQALLPTGPHLPVLVWIIQYLMKYGGPLLVPRTVQSNMGDDEEKHSSIKNNGCRGPFVVAKIVIKSFSGHIRHDMSSYCESYSSCHIRSSSSPSRGGEGGGGS